MAVKLSVGLQQKVGQPDYGSLGASCYLEFEIDRSLLESDRDGFQQQVRSAFAACQQSVDDQLAQQSGHSSPQPGNGQPNGIPHHTRHTLHSTGGDVAGATKSQIRAIFAIAKRQRLDPQSLVQERFQRNRLEDLSIREASSRIDELKRRTTEVPS